MYLFRGFRECKRLPWIVRDLPLVLYFLTGGVPLLWLLKALNWAGGVSGEWRRTIGAISPQNLWLDLAEVRFPLFRKVSLPRLLSRGNKVPLCAPVEPQYQWDGVLEDGEGDGMSAAVSSLHVGLHRRREAWLSLRCCPEPWSTEAGLIKCWIQLQSHYKPMWPTTFIGGVLSCGARLYCSDLIN